MPARYVHYADGRTVLVHSLGDLAALEPGWKDNPGMFLPPDHPAHVPEPRVPEAPPAPEPEPPAPRIEVTDDFTASEQDQFDQPVLPAPVEALKKRNKRRG